MPEFQFLKRNKSCGYWSALLFTALIASPAHGQTTTMPVGDALANLHLITFGHLYGAGPTVPYGWRDTVYANVDNIAAVRPTEQKVCGAGKTPVEWTGNVGGGGGGAGTASGIKDQHGYVVFLCVPS